MVAGLSGKASDQHETTPSRNRGSNPLKQAHVCICSNVDCLLKADHPLFDWLINCVILNHF